MKCYIKAITPKESSDGRQGETITYSTPNGEIKEWVSGSYYSDNKKVGDEVNLNIVSGQVDDFEIDGKTFNKRRAIVHFDPESMKPMSFEEAKAASGVDFKATPLSLESIQAITKAPAVKQPAEEAA